MSLSPKTIRAQQRLLLPLLRSISLETIRKWQNRIGEMMEARHRSQVMVQDHRFPDFDGAWIIPKDQRRQGVVLYLHGGGYTCGDLDYAKGFGSTLAIQCGARVFCAAYRLAPEHKCPAAVEDALTAYRYLLSKGYDPAHITLCGESAGGGLCYALCLKLKELGMDLPCGIIAISPWTDLTCSGESFEYNREKDTSLTCELLQFFAGAYTDTPEDPYASPLFGDLNGMPPYLIFAGGDEILLSDAQALHDRLSDCGCKGRLHITPERWHAYILYGLEEDQEDFSRMNQFLNRCMSPERKLRWLRLDNAAKIYPAARSEKWSNVFRLSVTLHEPVDKAVLESALDVTVRRFPSIAARLRKGVFWYYVQQLAEVPRIRGENSYPLARMSKEEMRKCALRVIVYQNRIALEIFHSLTDGTGGLILLKTLTAEYLQQKHGITIPPTHGVMDRLEEPYVAELEDSFLKYSGKLSASRRETDAWRMSGTPEPDGFLNLTCFTLPVDAVLKKAHEYGVSLTAFLSAATMMALQNLQEKKVPEQKRRKPIKVLIPVNLRRLFPSKSLRNFALYSIPEIDPRLGRYEFGEVCRAVHHKMGLDVEPKHMSMMIATNVNSELMPIVKVMPLFIKNIVMKAVFRAVGERKSCLSLSNLGAVQLPEEMKPYIARMDFILGVQQTAPYNCGVLSLGDTLYINFIRNIREPELEYHFHCVLRDLGLCAQVQSNRESNR